LDPRAFKPGPPAARVSATSDNSAGARQVSEQVRVIQHTRHGDSSSMKTYEHIQKHYQSPAVAKRYDASRYSDLAGRMNNRSAWRALQKALAPVPAGGRVLDIPCGTGRFSWHLARAGFKTVASDISNDMLKVAADAGPTSGARPQFLHADLFNLPFDKDEFDAVVCIRFMNLVGRQHRVSAVQQLSRVAPILVIGYYHPYTLKHVSRTVRHKLGLTRPPNERLTRARLAAEIAETGCRIKAVIPVAPLLSEEWIVLLERIESGDQRAKPLKGTRSVR
jgi:2-polyprenyl-3-methyl-5-hydroxy-6-metoxy-1,4-benzoquinol methylase